MKIDVTLIRHGLVTAGHSLVQRDLYCDLYTQVYGEPPHMRWLPSPRPGSTSRVLKRPDVNLTHMAQVLRSQGWAAYHWRDRHGITDAQDDTNTWLNYGRREGLIIGRYCSNLTAWLLSHT
jgi:hypothetical protein